MQSRFSAFHRTCSALIGAVLILSSVQPITAQAGLAPSAEAQEDGLRRGRSPQTGMLTFLGADPGRPVRMAAAMMADMPAEDRATAILDMYGPEFGIRDARQELRVERTEQPANGRQVVRYQQMYQGIPVMAGELIVNTTAEGALLSISGKISPDLGLSVMPAIGPDEAREAAYQLMSRNYGLDSARVSLSEPALWILDERLLKPSLRRAALAWRMEATVEGEAVRELILVDAQSGNVSLHFNQVDSSWTSAEIPTEPVSERAAPAVAFPALIPAGVPVLQPPQEAEAGITRYVSPAGNDNSGTNDCSSDAAPCRTIQRAVDAAAGGDTIKVAEGIYDGHEQGGAVVNTIKSLTLIGGWDPAFTAAAGYSIIDPDYQSDGVCIDCNAGMALPTFSMSNFIVRHGKQMGYTGGIGSQGKLTLTNVQVYENEGVGIRNWGTLTINRCEVYGNSGSGIDASSLKLTNCDVHHNGDSGIMARGVSIASSRIHDNTASSGLQQGGGVRIYVPDSAVTINNSAIYRNIAAGQGGGIHISGYPDSITINNTTISQNTAGTNSALTPPVMTPVHMNNVTVSENRNTRGGALLGLTGAMVYLQNSIIVGDPAVQCGDRLMPDAHTFLYGCKFYNDGGIRKNPTLGGFIPEVGYSPLRSTSPAIGAGNPATCRPTDQRGIRRLTNRKCDAGAYEYTQPGPAARVLQISGSPQHAVPGGAFRQPLKVVVFDAKGTPVGAGVGITFSAPATGASAVFTGSGTNSFQAVTNAFGYATSPALKANSQFGDYTVTASAAGTPSPAEFSLGNGFWTVSPDGDDANNCFSPLSPCRDIASVVARPMFYPGDTIRAAAGVFDVMSGVQFKRDAILSGGWGPDFASVTGTSTLKTNMEILSVASVTIERAILQGGPGAQGGYIANNGTLVLRDSAVRDGHGIENSGKLTVLNSSITGNEPWGATGGGIRNFEGGQARIVNSTISNNTASQGGGIWNDSAGAKLEIYYSTIAYNTATYQGSGGIEAWSNVKIGNSVIVGNVTPSTGIMFAPDCRGKFISVGYNIVGNVGSWNPGYGAYACGTKFTASDLWGRPGKVINPAVVLGPLTSVPDGMQVNPLKPGSPAIDLGDLFPRRSGANPCPPKDQRGMKRPQGQQCDSGAYEYLPEQSGSMLLATYDAGHTVRLPGEKKCDQTDLGCAGAVSDAQQAHRFAAGVYDFYLTHHGRNSLDGSGVQIMSAVRYGTGYASAFWNGYMVVYGDKYGFAQADDVAAHELTHGVTQTESNLFYYYQSGAINESFSDLWGEAYDQLNGLGNDAAAVEWLIGEDVTGLGAVRNMKNPPQFDDPDRMTSTRYYKGALDNGGVHTNSGINNKAASLMVAGGTFNNRTVAPLGWSRVLAIYYEAQTNLLTSGSDYLDLHNALYQACLNKIGAAGIQADDCQQVRYATLAVEMDKQPAAGFNPAVTNLCPPATTYKLLYMEKFEAGAARWVMESAWGLSTGYATSGVNMLWGDDARIDANSSASMLSSISLPAGSRSYLYFKHAFGFDSRLEGATLLHHDGGVLEYSANGGAWTDAKALFKAGKGYGGIILVEGSTNPLRGRYAFVGVSHGYVDSQYDLGTLAGKKVRFRWHMGTDHTGYDLGWVLDDVSIYTCLPIPSKPALQAPANNASLTDYTPAFNWSDSLPKPHHYQIQVAADSAFTSIAMDHNVTVSTFTPPADLAIGQAYYWRVRALNAAGGTAGWTAARVFKTIPIAPALLAPEDAVTLPDNRPAFDWSDVPGASDYTLQVAADAAFTAPVLLEVNVMDSTFTPDSDLPAGTLLYWRARANSPAGSSGWSAARFFQIASSGGAPGRSAEPPQAAPE